MKSRCLVRLWTMRMTPRQDVELFVVQMAMAVVVMLVGCIGMVMRIIMVTAMLIVLVVTMHVIVLLMPPAALAPIRSSWIAFKSPRPLTHSNRAPRSAMRP